MIQINTDGSCTSGGRFKGVGGWAYIILSTNDGIEIENAGGVIDTTNNRMEMQGVLEALKHILELKHLFNEKEIMFYCDSQLVVETLRQGSKYKQNKNLDLWQQIFEVKKKVEDLGFTIDFTWIDRKLNKRADKLATKARDKVKDILCWI